MVLIFKYLHKANKYHFDFFDWSLAILTKPYENNVDLRTCTLYIRTLNRFNDSFSQSKLFWYIFKTRHTTWPNSGVRCRILYSVWFGLTSIPALTIWKQVDTIQNLNKSELPNLFEHNSNVVPSVQISFSHHWCVSYRYSWHMSS